jgi:hypothetical protein
MLFKNVDFREIRPRSLNFVLSYIAHESSLIRFIAQYGVLYARSSSFHGQNVFCMQRRVVHSIDKHHNKDIGEV